MCGRFALLTTGGEIAAAFDLAEVPEMAPRYNIAPTQPVAAIRIAPGSGQKALTYFHWGLIPFWSKDPKIGARMINARSETVAEKPSFRAAYKYRRCIIPATGFYEWQKLNGQKQPMFIHGRDDALLGLAGLWEHWQSSDGSEIESCTILTTSPNDFLRPIHNRMPVILEGPDYDTWLYSEPGNLDQLQHLLRPYPAELLAAHPVSSYVNNARNEGPECVLPL